MFLESFGCWRTIAWAVTTTSALAIAQIDTVETAEALTKLGVEGMLIIAVIALYRSGQRSSSEHHSQRDAQQLAVTKIAERAVAEITRSQETQRGHEGLLVEIKGHLIRDSESRRAAADANRAAAEHLVEATRTLKESTQQCVARIGETARNV